MRCLLFPLLFFFSTAAGQVVVEYKVLVEEAVSPEQKAALPLKVLMATDGERVVVRGFWETPRNSYQLYIPSENAFFHCDIDGTVAVRYPYAPYDNATLTMAPPKTIAGVYCNEAILVEGRDTFSIYYTDAFGMQFCQIARVPGFAMRYTKRLQGVKVTYEAVKYHFEQVPQEMFSLGDRKVIAQDELSDGRKWAMQIGKKAPRIKGKCLDGSRFNAKNYAGKVLVIDINSLLPPNTPFFQDELWLNALAVDYAANPGVVFLGIYQQQEEVLKKFIRQDALSYKIMSDGLFYIEAFRLEVLPAIMVIYPSGRIAEYVTGHNPESELRIKRAIDLALQGGLKPEGLD